MVAVAPNHFMEPTEAYSGGFLSTPWYQWGLVRFIKKLLLTIIVAYVQITIGAAIVIGIAAVLSPFGPMVGAAGILAFGWWREWRQG